MYTCISQLCLSNSSGLVCIGAMWPLPMYICVSLLCLSNSSGLVCTGAMWTYPMYTCFSLLCLPTDQACFAQVQGLMQGAYSYRNAFHAVSSIVQQQGLPGLMKGYWATNSVWFPWNMIYIASYEKSKAMLACQLQASTCAPWWRSRPDATKV